LRRLHAQLEWRGFLSWRAASVQFPSMGTRSIRTPAQRQTLSSLHASRRTRRLSGRRRFLRKAPAREERFPLLSVAEKVI
jgi:hypothetical protein